MFGCMFSEFARRHGHILENHLGLLLWPQAKLANPPSNVAAARRGGRRAEVGARRIWAWLSCVHKGAQHSSRQHGSARTGETGVEGPAGTSPHHQGLGEPVLD